jgi:AraC family transcriptional regulator
MSAVPTYPAAEATHLVRRAMTFFDTDRAAAWRCPNEASTNLGAQMEPNAAQRGGLPAWRAKRTLAYIEANLASKITIGDLADLVSLSKSHFSRAFKQSLGSCPMSYVAARRVEHAKLMMTSSRERLSDIALACGFVDQPHLNRYFRRVVGTSPGLWRRSLLAPKFGDFDSID